MTESFLLISFDETTFEEEPPILKVNLPDREEHWVRFRRLSWMRQLLLRISSRVFSSRRCQCIVYTACMSPGAYSTSSSANRIAFKTLNRPVTVVSGWVQHATAAVSLPANKSSWRKISMQSRRNLRQIHRLEQAGPNRFDIMLVQRGEWFFLVSCNNAP